MGTERGLSALQHSLWPDVCSNRLAMWTKALSVLGESMNFHPDKGTSMYYVGTKGGGKGSAKC